jgi:hypothetical protein
VISSSQKFLLHFRESVVLLILWNLDYVSTFLAHFTQYNVAITIFSLQQMCKRSHGNKEYRMKASISRAVMQEGKSLMEGKVMR